MVVVRYAVFLNLKPVCINTMQAPAGVFYDCGNFLDWDVYIKSTMSFKPEPGVELSTGKWTATYVSSTGTMLVDLEGGEHVQTWSNSTF